LLGAKSRRDVASVAKLLVFMGLYFAATLLAGFAIFELAKLLSNCSFASDKSSLTGNI